MRDDRCGTVFYSIGGSAEQLRVSGISHMRLPSDSTLLTRTETVLS